MNAAFVGALYFQGNHALAMRFLKDHLYIIHMLSGSRFNRRVHAIDFDFWQIMFSALKTALVQTKKDFEYVVDSFPVEACHAARSYRCKILRGRGFIGYCAAKKEVLLRCQSSHDHNNLRGSCRITRTIPSRICLEILWAFVSFRRGNRV
jgi:hypothetical protein